MITNANLLRIDNPKPATTSGRVDYVEGGDVHFRCLLVDPGFQSIRLIDELQLKANASLFVSLQTMPDAKDLLNNNVRVTVQVDGEQPQMLRVEHRLGRTKSTLTHVECLVRSE